jgi:hypothetical protein
VNVSSLAHGRNSELEAGWAATIAQRALLRFRLLTNCDISVKHTAR